MRDSNSINYYSHVFIKETATVLQVDQFYVGFVESIGYSLLYKATAALHIACLLLLPST